MSSPMSSHALPRPPTPAHAYVPYHTQVNSETCKSNNYAQSLMERLQSALPEASTLLEEQYRMHPHICEWVSQKFYNGRLR